MIKMAQKQYIKHLWEEEGKSLREISRRTGLSFQTVQKYAYQKDWTPEQPVEKDADPSRYPVLGPYLRIIDEWLENDRREPRKQRHTATRIFHRLQKEHGYSGGYTSVKEYVRKRKRQMYESGNSGYLPLEQPKAHGQIDFWQFKYYDVLGRDQLGYALTISFPYSNAAFVQVFKSENQECLLEGMKRIFSNIGGTPVRLKADNMTTAVAHILEDGQRELSEGFARFMLHYRFQADFCNPASGNEKGNVENKVGYGRRNFLVPIPIIEDFEEFNQALFGRCEEDMNRSHYKHGITILKRWQAEQKHLLTLPEYEYYVFRYETARVNNYGCVLVDTNRYGISPDYAGQMAQLRIYYDRVEIYHNHTLLKTYKRSYGRNEEILDWKQYIGVMCKKPGGAVHTRFFGQIPRLWREHLQTAARRERKSALLVLQEIVRDGNEKLAGDAIDLARECGRLDADSIRQCYYMISKAEHHPLPLTFSSQTPTLGYNPNLTAYDNLMGGER